VTDFERLEIVFTADQFARLRAHLLQDNQDEQAAYAFVAPAAGGGALRLLVHHSILLTPDNFTTQSDVYLEVKPEIAAQIAQLALEGDYGLIEIHSHPFAADEVHFSETDIEYALPRFRWFAEQMTGHTFHHAMLVLGVNRADALYYDRAADAMVAMDRVVILESPLRELVMVPFVAPADGASKAVPPASPTLPPTDPAYHQRTARQIGAFGATGQARLADIRIGIVGLGGIGSIMAQQLALLGARDFVLVDGDALEVSNLNRFVGATLADAQAGMLKVDAIARLIRALDPHAQVTKIPTAFPTADAITSLKGADVLFGCTDTHGSRLLLNAFSAQYLLPYIDIGVGIFTDPDGTGRITEAGGQFRVVMPGSYCLNCIDAIDTAQAARDLLPAEARVQHQARGYIPTEDMPAPSVIFLNATLASLAVGEFLNLVSGYRPPSAILYYFMQTQELRRITAVRNPACVVCGASGRLALGDLESVAGLEVRPRAMPFPKAGG